MSSLSEASVDEDTLSETFSEKMVDMDNADRSIDDLRARRCRQEDLKHHSLWSRLVQFIFRTTILLKPKVECFIIL